MAHKQSYEQGSSSSQIKMSLDSNQAPASSQQFQRRDLLTNLATAVGFGFGLAAPSYAIVDYEGVKYLGGGDKIDLNNVNIRAFAKLPGMYPTIGGKILSNVPKKGFANVKDIYNIPVLNDKEKEVIKKYEDKFIVLAPESAYVIDRLNNGLYR